MNKKVIAKIISAANRITERTRPTLNTAITLSANGHVGQTDKNGEPYILHPIRVMLQMKTEQERIVAVLHDIIEDTEMSANHLLFMGYPDKVVDAVVAITKLPGEKYLDYLGRVNANPIARKVKIADIKDNLSEDRIKNCCPPCGPSVRARLWHKYQKALVILS